MSPAQSPYVPNPNLKDDDVVTAPAFPLQILPERLQRVVADCEQFLSFPAELTAAGILAATALAIARTHRLYYQGEWRESACLYLAIVAPPGSAKTHPLRFALDPIIKGNKKAIKDYAAAQAQLAQNGEVTDNLRDKQCLFSDFTIESLARAVQKNARGVSVYIDELSGWFANFNRYNAGSEQEFWLENWSGGSMAISRMQRKAWLESPSISVVGTIQPGRLEEIGKGGRSVNGFSERILYVYPDKVPVIPLKKRLERSDTSLIMQKNYAPVMQYLLDQELAIEGDDELAHEVVIEPSADDLITDYLNDLKQRMDAIDNEYMRNVYSKLQTYTLRFCLILNRLEYACAYQSNREFPPMDNYTVTLDQARKATELTEYFLRHAMKANNAINAHNPVDKLPLDEKKFYKSLPFGEQFTTRQAEDIAERHGISRAKLYRMLNPTDPTKKLFLKQSHGVYERLYV